MMLPNAPEDDDDVIHNDSEHDAASYDDDVVAGDDSGEDAKKRDTELLEGFFSGEKERVEQFIKRVGTFIRQAIESVGIKDSAVEYKDLAGSCNSQS